MELKTLTPNIRKSNIMAKAPNPKVSAGNTARNNPKKVNIDNVEYDYDALSDAAKAQLFHLQAIGAELLRLNTEVAIHQTARTAYANALNAELAKSSSATVTK